MIQSKNLPFVRIALAGGAIVSAILGCGVDSTQDRLSRNKDLAREQAANLTKDYKILTGTYQTDPTQDKSGLSAKMVMVMMKYPTSNGGPILSQPGLDGQIIFLDTLTPTGKAAGGIQRAVAFSQGNYDPLSQEFTAAITGNGVTGPNLYCNALFNKKSDGTQDVYLKCFYSPSTGAVKLTFIFKKISNETALRFP